MTGEVLWHPKHGKLILVEESFSLLKVAAADSDEADPFWLSKTELERFNRRATLAHLLPTRAPVESDLPWQAYLRKHGYIDVRVWEGYVYKAINLIENVSGYCYPRGHSGFRLIKDRKQQWAPSFRITWTGGTVPDDLPLKPYHYTGADLSSIQHMITKNSFILDLLGLGFVFGGKEAG